MISCGGKQGPQHYGQVSIPLTSTGSDGSIYRLPLGSSVQLNNTDGNFGLQEGLDLSLPEIDVSVPPGAYEATLLDPAQDDPTPTPWTLDKLEPPARSSAPSRPLCSPRCRPTSPSPPTRPSRWSSPRCPTGRSTGTPPRSTSAC